MQGPLARIVARLRATAGRPIDVFGVGECSQDQVLMLPDGTPPDALSRPGAKLTAAGYTVLGGGQIATALCAAQRLGRKAAFCGVVGGDAAGAAVLAELAAEGVDVGAVHRAAAAQTRGAVIAVHPGGERVVLELRDPALVLPAGLPADAAIAAARAVHVDGTFPAASLRAARLARAGGAVVSIDLDRAGPESAELVALADVCAVSADFPAALTGERDLEAAARALALRTDGLVVVTLGERGCLAAPRIGAHVALLHVPAWTPPAIVDTTACGDTFHAALLVALLDVADLADVADQADAPDGDAQAALTAVLRFAGAAAALKCAALGRRGCPTRAALDAFLSA